MHGHYVTMNAVKLLFLDFDGTYWPFGQPEKARKEQLAWLMQEHPELQIVVSSNWRISATLETLKTYFAPDIADRVTGTLALADDGSPGGRQLLVEQYLADFERTQGTTVDAFVVLDDLDYLFEEDYPYLVHIKGTVAMETRHMTQAHAVLRSQYRGARRAG